MKEYIERTTILGSAWEKSIQSISALCLTMKHTALCRNAYVKLVME